jgi:predicted amidohydrolase
MQAWCGLRVTAVPFTRAAVLILGLALAAAADETIRVGLVQMDGKVYDKEYNMSRAEKGIRQAAARGAKVVCTPEVAVQGYPRTQLPQGMSFDDPKLVVDRSKILAAAEPIPGPASNRFAALAKELGIWIILGMDENRGGKLFNTAVLINPQGSIVGSYSKVHLQNWMLASGVNHGDGFPVWDTVINGVKAKLGIEICYDIQHPESTLELAMGGAEVVFNPYCTSDFARPLLVHLYQTRALENQLYLVRVHYGASRGNGGSAIFDFNGATQDELGASEDVLVGDLNLTALRKRRDAWNKVYGPANRYAPAYGHSAKP